jgi:hypothetical protein
MSSSKNILYSQENNSRLNKNSPAVDLDGSM